MSEINSVTIKQFVDSFQNVTNSHFHVYQNQCVVIDASTMVVSDANFHNAVKMDAVVFFLCTQGSLVVSKDGKDYTIRSGNIFCKHPGLVIQQKAMRNFGMVGILISSDLMRQLNPSIRKMLPMLSDLNNYSLLATTSEQRQTLKRLIQVCGEIIESNNTNMYYNEAVKASLVSLIYYIFTIVSAHTSRSSAISSSDRMSDSSKEDYVQKFLVLLNQHYTKERSVAFYAKQLGITPKYLTLLLKDFTGKTTNEWIDDIIINETKNYLRYSNKSVQEIAAILHFPNQSFFGKFFKNHTGISPRRFRVQGEN